MSLDPRLDPVAGVADVPGFTPGVACSVTPMAAAVSPPLSDDALSLLPLPDFFFFLPVMIAGGAGRRCNPVAPDACRYGWGPS